MGRLRDRLQSRIPRDEDTPQYQPVNSYEPDYDNYDIPNQNQLSEERPIDPNLRDVGRGYVDEVVPNQQYQQQVPLPPSPMEMQEYQRKKFQDEINEQQKYHNPLAILDEIKRNPSPKGTHPIMIGGRPLDLHALENYVVKVSPYHLRTILRYHNARTIEEVKNYSQRFGVAKLKGSTLLVILLAVGMGILGIVMMFFLPDIIATFSGGM